MTAALEPAAKRRRVEHESIPTYVTIAKVVDDIEVTEDGPTQLGDSHGKPVPAIVKDITFKNGMISVRLASASKQGSSNITFTRDTSSDDALGGILRSVRGIESIHRCKKDRPPLVCSDITFTSSYGQSFHLEVKILWHDTAEARKNMLSEQLAILFRYVRSEREEDRPTEVAQPWNPRDFYENVHVPASTPELSGEFLNDMMTCRLFPFQRRAVRWLLKCEGVQLGHNGRIEAPERDMVSLPPSFFKTRDMYGRHVYASQLLGVVSSNLQDVRNTYPEIRGGVLAEEMGLGKTVELIALMCLHRRHDCHPAPDFRLEQVAQDHRKLSASRATLIITPPSILEQWKQELDEHAPGLKVFHYSGTKVSKRRRAENIILDLADNDVVLTTYSVLAQEIHYARGRPDRQLRERSRHEFPKSPLTEISWWRVCLDEAQMVESGVSQAAQVARLIPRVNAWAVSGTPLRAEHKDLYGLFLFLQLEPFCQSLPVWNRMLGFYRPLFKQSLREIAIRHSKKLVRDDLRLPDQVRHTVTVPFTAIEQQHYDQLFQEMCEDVGLDSSGGPVTELWDPNEPLVVEKMRSWLNRLRQTCLHPEVGGRNRRALGRNHGPLRSVMQVLEVMTDQNEGAVRAEQRLILLSQLRRGQMHEYAKAPERAIDMWKTVYSQTKSIVSDCRLLLATETEQLRLKEEFSNKSTKKHLVDEDEAYVDSRLGAYKQRLRAALEVLHMSIFFLGNAYFQMKSKEDVDPSSRVHQDWEEKEEAAFEEAKKIRAELLSDILKKASRLIDKVKQGVCCSSLAKIPDMHVAVEIGGIENRKILEKLHSLCRAMNAQSDQYIEWRDQMAEFLQQSLVDAEDGSIELSGEEYEASTRHQDETYVYMEALRAMFADRNDALTGQVNFLIAHEMKLALQKGGKGEGPAPQLFLQVLAQREMLRIPTELGSLRGIIVELRQLMTALQWQEVNGSSRARAELSIVSDALKSAQEMSSAQQKAIMGMEKEVELFRDTMNNRLEYYRGLQKISDTVAPYEPVGHNPVDAVDMREYNRSIDNEQRREAKLSVLLAKHRYLAHLKAEQSASGLQRLCVICQSTFEQGTLTVCGHIYCRDCILHWWHHHRSCPTCKKPLKGTDFHDITYKPQDPLVQKETEHHLASPARLSSAEFEPSEPHLSTLNKIYSDLSATTLNEIKNIELRQGLSFGTKVDTMCRHVLWLREHDPGSKAIFFSQYREFLDILGAAMVKNQISFSRIDFKNGIEKFKKSPNLECFLLHAKAHSAGLNLVNANHVFLCEPLINTALELQAIARVHRIGQQRETTVWMYLVADTVEEAIYEISVTRRLAHLHRRTIGQAATSASGTLTPGEAGLTEGAIEAANSLELQSADLAKLLTSGTSGGEVVDHEDLWQCLFGKASQKGQGLSATLGEADTEVGRLLRAQAGEERRGSQSSG